MSGCHYNIAGSWGRSAPASSCDLRCHVCGLTIPFRAVMAPSGGQGSQRSTSGRTARPIPSTSGDATYAWPRVSWSSSAWRRGPLAMASKAASPDAWIFQWCSFCDKECNWQAIMKHTSRFIHHQTSGGSSSSAEPWIVNNDDAPTFQPCLHQHTLLCFSQKLDPQHRLQHHEPPSEPTKQWFCNGSWCTEVQFFVRSTTCVCNEGEQASVWSKGKTYTRVHLAIQSRAATRAAATDPRPTSAGPLIKVERASLSIMNLHDHSLQDGSVRNAEVITRDGWPVARTSLAWHFCRHSRSRNVAWQGPKPCSYDRTWFVSRCKADGAQSFGTCRRQGCCQTSVLACVVQ